MHLYNICVFAASSASWFQLTFDLSPLPAFATMTTIFLHVLNSNSLKDDPNIPLSSSFPFDYHLAIPTYRALAEIKLA